MAKGIETLNKRILEIFEFEVKMGNIKLPVADCSKFQLVPRIASHPASQQVEYDVNTMLLARPQALVMCMNTNQVKNLIGDVNDCTVLMFDDLVSTAGTICEAARLVMDKGAKDVICAATHGVFVGMALERIQNSPISQLVVTDTISCTGRCDAIADKLVELSVGKLLGEAIHRIHHDQSISAMFRTIIGTKR